MASQVRVFLSGLQTPVGLGGWAIQLLGRSPSSDAPGKESGIWELFIPGAHNGQLYNMR